MKRLRDELQDLAEDIEILTRKTKHLSDDLRRKAAAQVEKARAAINPQGAARKTVETLKALRNATDKMIQAVEKFEHQYRSKPREDKPKAARKTVGKGATKKAVAASRAAMPTATEQVIGIIKKSKSGIDVPALMKKTDFAEKKVRNIVSRAFKQGKIKRAGRGLYVTS